jgi:hypothetical protein
MNRLDIQIKEICEACQAGECSGCKIQLKTENGVNVVVDGETKTIISAKEGT